MKDESMMLIFAVMVSFMFFAIGARVGVDTSNDDWADKLVDQPETIAAIRSRVLAERAVKDMLKPEAK